MQNVAVEAGRSGARNRLWALIVLSLGSLMISLDSTIVIVALPQIRADLRFSDASLVWVMNAYLLTFGGSLLLAGRSGDLFGHRRVFLLGVALFTLASLGCGIAGTQGLLITARSAQGVGGAVIYAVALSLAVDLFADAKERAKAIGVFSFVTIGGGSIALLLGGVLTSALSWHWIFFVNIPLGVVIYTLGTMLLPKAQDAGECGRLDVAGAVTVTVSLTLALYAIVGQGASGKSGVRTTIALVMAAVLSLLAFLRIEAKARNPLIPLGLFRLKNFATVNALFALSTAAAFAWCVIITLYLQLILKFDPLHVGLAFLPSNQVFAVFQLGVSHHLVSRLNPRPLIAAGLSLSAVGFALFAIAPVGGRFWVNVLPGTLLTTVGIGMASTPLLLAAMNSVSAKESGLVSGVINTAGMMGGALGLAVLTRIAAARTHMLLASGAGLPDALNGGYHLAFLVGSIVLIAAASVSATLVRVGPEHRVLRG